MSDDKKDNKKKEEEEVRKALERLAQVSSESEDLPQLELSEEFINEPFDFTWLDSISPEGKKEQFEEKGLQAILDDDKTDRELKKWYGYILLGLLGFQVAALNFFFLIVILDGPIHFELLLLDFQLYIPTTMVDASVANVFFGGIIIEIPVLVHVVVKYLFPNERQSRKTVIEKLDYFNNGSKEKESSK